MDLAKLIVEGLRHHLSAQSSIRPRFHEKEDRTIALLEKLLKI